MREVVERFLTLYPQVVTGVIVHYTPPFVLSIDIHHFLGSQH